MIRINLARSTVATSPIAQGGGSSAGSSAAALGAGMGAHPGVKLVAIFLLPLAIYIYEKRELGIKKNILNVENAKLEKIKAEVNKYGAVTAAVEDLKKERNKLQQRLEVIASISRKRASKILTLNEIQRIIPEDTWLDSIKIDEGKIVIDGLSRVPSSVQVFVEKLAQLKFLKSAVNKGVTRTKLGDTNLHKFTVEAEIKEER